MDDVNTVAFTASESEWEILLDQLENVVGKRPSDLNAVLFLIGMQELGRGPRRFSKEQKQDLLHIAVCKVMSLSGHYSFDGFDAEGWPIWTLINPIPEGNLSDQETYLKANVIRYFEQALTH